MLQPKKRKYAKDFRGRRKGVASRGFSLSLGNLALRHWKVVGLLPIKLRRPDGQLPTTLKREVVFG